MLKTFSQKRNDIVITKEHMNDVVTASKDAVNEDAVRDMIVASICIKYTQSNSVGFAKDGMMVGVGAGQQSRVDCVKLAGKKTKTWYVQPILTRSNIYWSMLPKIFFS